MASDDPAAELVELGKDVREDVRQGVRAQAEAEKHEGTIEAKGETVEEEPTP